MWRRKQGISRPDTSLMPELGAQLLARQVYPRERSCGALVRLILSSRHREVRGHDTWNPLTAR
jgi:hypothetical protein